MPSGIRSTSTLDLTNNFEDKDFINNPKLNSTKFFTVNSDFPESILSKILFWFDGQDSTSLFNNKIVSKYGNSNYNGNTKIKSLLGYKSISFNGQRLSYGGSAPSNVIELISVYNYNNTKTPPMGLFFGNGDAYTNAFYPTSDRIARIDNPTPSRTNYYQFREGEAFIGSGNGFKSVGIPNNIKYFYKPKLLRFSFAGYLSSHFYYMGNYKRTYPPDFHGNIYEIILLKERLTDDEARQLNFYLYGKYKRIL